MQRQKTIAKWLAVILLLTAVIACYIVFGTISKNKTADRDIAGANGNDSAVLPDTPVPKPEPVYSTFPRSPQEVDGLYVSHVGGEDNELLLDTLYFAGKRYVFFFSASVQYDVKECGLHIAQFKDGNLISTSKFAEADETFVTASIVENGILVITKNSAQTKLRLLSAELSMICENSCPLYSDYKLYVTSAGARLYTADGGFVYANTVTSSLDVNRSIFAYPVAGAKLAYVAGLPSCDVVFVQSAQGVGFLTFTQTDGFKCKSQLANAGLLQVLPVPSNGKAGFAVLAKCDGGISATALDENLLQTACYKFEGAKTAVALADNNNIRIIADGASATFCSHLDLQSSAPVTFDGNLDGATYTAIDGEKKYILISEGSSHTLAKIEGESLIPLRRFMGRTVRAVRDVINGKAELSVYFDGNANNAFASMCFGASDVFAIRVKKSQ